MENDTRAGTCPPASPFAGRSFRSSVFTRSVTDCVTRVPARISAGKGNPRGVQYVLKEASVQFLWSSISKTSPCIDSFTHRSVETSCSIARISRNGW